MKKLGLLILMGGLCAATAVQAEVTHMAPGGFITVNELVIDTDRETAWNVAIDEVGAWWDSAHTVSGDAARMHIDAIPQGCFCESLDGESGVVHMVVTMVNRNVVLRLTGGLGPLGLMGVDGNMTWEFADADGATRVKFTYAVGGYSPDGLDKIAAPVDYVVGQALKRLKIYAETGSAEVANLD